MIPRNSCELCKGEAFLYCYSDSAFLCWECDRRVHSANFLVGRHLRQFACDACSSFCDFSLSLSGSGSTNPIRSICHSCHPNPNPSPSNSSSSCISTAESESESNSDSSSESESGSSSSPEARMMESWGDAIGLRRGKLCADLADHVMRACKRELAAVPLRAAMAAALWHEAKACDRTCAGMVEKLERCCGVPARVIVVQASRIKHAVRRRRVAMRVEEGWGETESL